VAVFDPALGPDLMLKEKKLKVAQQKERMLLQKKWDEKMPLRKDQGRKTREQEKKEKQQEEQELTEKQEKERKEQAEAALFLGRIVK
jgi:hypothetical protein